MATNWTPLAAADGRKASRINVTMTARLRERGVPLNIKVIDLSTTGLRAETVCNVPIGTRMFIALPGLSSIEATAVWRGPQHVGFAFKSPLHPAIFDHVVALAR